MPSPPPIPRLTRCSPAQYEFERRKYAQDLIAFDRQFSALFSGKPETEEFQDGVSHEEVLKYHTPLLFCIYTLALTHTTEHSRHSAVSPGPCPPPLSSAYSHPASIASGIGIHYAPSAITDDRYQDAAAHLVVGERVVPQVLLRAADRRPYEIQDLLPSDARFKVLVFVGDNADGGADGGATDGGTTIVHSTNGDATHGYTTNGHNGGTGDVANGHTTNGGTTNGGTTNGGTTNGDATHGYTGDATNGATSNGATNGATTNRRQRGRRDKLSADLERLLSKYSRTQKLEVLFDVLSIR